MPAPGWRGLCNVTMNQRCDQVGELKMEQVIKDCGEDAKIAIMTGTLGQDTTNQICGGYDAVLEKYPNVEVVFEGAGNWGATDAAPLAENWLASGKEIDAIVCNIDRRCHFS